MKNIVKIDAGFQKSINLALDLGDPDRVSRYIPTRSSTAILKDYLEAIKNTKREHATILIGPYGKGKSHLLLVLLTLLCTRREEETRALQKKILETDPSMGDLLEGHRGKPFLAVILSSFQEDLNQSFIYALQEALKREGITDLAPESEYTEAVRILDLWEREYEDTYLHLEELLEESGDTATSLRKKLEEGSRQTLDQFKKWYPLLTAGSSFAPMIQRDAMRVYDETCRALCEQYSYAGIYIVFDEFSKYIEGHEGSHFSRDMKTLQDLCELSDKRGEGQIYLTFVAHKSIHEYEKQIDAQLVQTFRGVEGRIREVQFVVSSQNNYELIGNAVQKKSGFDTEHIHQKMMESYILSCFSNLFEEKDFERIVARGCYPLTPVCAYALLHISERIGQNERTIFTFLAGNEPEGLSRLIAERRPEELIGIDSVYDYFKNQFRETVDQPYLHNEWLKADYALTRADSEEERRIIKAAAVIRMIRRPEELTVKKRDICLALDICESEYEAAMEGLIQKEILFFRASLGTYTFKNNIGIDIESAIEKEKKRLERGFRVCGLLNEISELTYAFPKQYNQDCFMTRYFRYEFIEYEDFLAIQDSKVFFENRFCDGYILALLIREKADGEQVLAHLNTWEDERMIVFLPEKEFTLDPLMLRLAAIRSLSGNPQFLEENKVLRQELDLYEEDVRYEMNEKLKRDFMPENGGCRVLHIRKEEPVIHTGMEFTRYLSEICEDYYALSPRVNHELLNIQNVQGQYLRARNEVIRMLLSGEDLSSLKRGSSPEAMVYRSALMRTGITGQDFPLDGGCRKILEEIEDFFAKSGGKKVSFSILYQRLQGKDYGVRKGILPLFLAWELCLLEGVPVIYLGKKEAAVTVEILNSINQFPESYELFIEEKDIEKEKYLRDIEDIFCCGRQDPVRGSNRFALILEEIQKWYRSLPQYTRVSDDYPREMLQTLQRVRQVLKKAETNPREVLFEQLPKEAGDTGYRKASDMIRELRRQMDFHLERELDDAADQIRKIFCARKEENLRACLLEWRRAGASDPKKYILDQKAEIFLEYLDQLETNDQREIVAALSKRIEDVYVEDWNDQIKTAFLEDINQIKSQIEEKKTASAAQTGQKEIFLKNADGIEIHKYYDADTEDTTSGFLRNMIEEALDNFGDSLETNQKVAVLAETLEKLLQ